MKSFKVIEILNVLSKVQLNRLGKFIRSPYHNVNDSITMLFDVLQNSKKAGIIPHPTDPKELWSLVYKQSKFDDKKFRKLRNNLMKLIEEFIAIESIKSDPFLIPIHLTKQVSERSELSILQTSSVKTMETELSKQSAYSSDRYHSTYEFLKYKQDFTSDFEKKKQILKQEYNQEVSKDLDKYYVLEKLKTYYEFVGSKRLLKPGVQEVFFITEIFEKVENNYFKEEYVIQAYYLICKLISNQADHGLYQKLKELVELQFLRLEQYDRKTLIYGLMNYCIGKVNSGLSEFAKEYILICQKYLRTDIFYDREYLALANYRNTIVMALKSDQLEWAEDFILRYTDDLKPEYRANALSFNLARVYWYKKEFDKVQEKLAGVEYEDIFYSLGAKTLLAAVYYELGEDDVLASHLSTFRSYLNRTKNITENRKQGYKNFISYLRKIMNIVGRDRKTINKIKDDLQDKRGVVNKDWLLEKLAEMS